MKNNIIDNIIITSEIPIVVRYFEGKIKVGSTNNTTIYNLN